MPDIDHQAAADAQRVKADQDKKRREHEEKMRKAQLLRADLVLALADLGLEENLYLQYAPEGIFPMIRLASLAPEKVESIKEQVQKHKNDLLALGAGIIGTDSEPLAK